MDKEEPAKPAESAKASSEIVLSINMKDIEELVNSVVLAGMDRMSPEKQAIYFQNFMVAKRKRQKNAKRAKKLQKIASALPKMESTDAESGVSFSDMDSFDGHVKRELKWVFEERYDATPKNSQKWLDALENFFREFPGLKEILTAKKYDEADFSGRKIEWSGSRFYGKESVLIALKKMDSTITKYLRTADLFEMEVWDTKRMNVRGIWKMAHKINKRGMCDRVDSYIGESIEYWKTITQNLPEDACRDYLSLMYKKYDQTFMYFMEPLGFSTFMLWIRTRDTALAPCLTATIVKLEAQYRKKPFIVKGIFTVMEELGKSQWWREAILEEKCRRWRMQEEAAWTEYDESNRTDDEDSKSFTWVDLLPSSHKQYLVDEGMI